MSDDAENEPRRILVTGASSVVARYLVPLLLEDGRELVLISRSRPDFLAGLPEPVWVRADLCEMQSAAAFSRAVDTLIHLAPLPLLPAIVNSLRPAFPRRIVAFGTTSRLTKAESGSVAERRMVAEQAEAEDWLKQLGDALGIRWTLFRPTMIYDGQNDKNVTLIARFIRRFGFFPLVGEASGKRQPVHAADLAQACRLVLDNKAAYGNIYNLAGGEVLSYRKMIERIFAREGKTPRYLHIPPALLRTGLGLARRLPRYRYLDPAMAGRMNKDMAFDCAEAARDFNYRPRPFMPAISTNGRETI